MRVPWTARRSNWYSKGDQSWVFFGRTDAKSESLLIGKDFDAGRDWGHEQKGMTEDEMT